MTKPKRTEIRGWHWCRLPGNDHVRGQFGECHYCDDGYEEIEELLRIEDEQCRCTDDGDSSRCGWHNPNADVDEHYRLLAQEGEQA